MIPSSLEKKRQRIAYLKSKSSLDPVPHVPPLPTTPLIIPTPTIAPPMNENQSNKLAKHKERIELLRSRSSKQAI